MRGTGLALTCCALLALAGCGSSPDADAGERPTVAAIAETLRGVSDDPETAYTPQEADCIAKILVDSDLSDSALTGIAAGKPGFEKSDEDDARYRALVPQISACLVSSLPSPKQTD